MRPKSLFEVSSSRFVADKFSLVHSSTYILQLQNKNRFESYYLLSRSISIASTFMPLGI